MNETDEDLIAAVAKGDNQAFRVLFQRYSRAVFGYACRMMGGDRYQTEDVVQTVWEKLIHAAPSYSGKGFPGWLFSIVRYTAVDALRVRGRWTGALTDEESGEENFSGDNAISSPEELLIQFGKRQELQSRIDQLPDRQRVALVSWMETDLSQKELAEQLGLTVKALESLLLRAKRTILGDRK